MKINSFRKLLNLIFISATASALLACGEQKKQTYDHINHENFYGVCALTGEGGRADATGLTSAWTKDRIKAMGFKSMRFWITLEELFEFDENDNILVKQSNVQIQRNFLNACVEGGVEHFLVLISGFICPYGTHYDNSYSTPDPEVEPELYLKWLHANGRACAKLVEIFPEFDTIECGNEPDFDNSTCIHRDGYIWNGDYAMNAEYLYSDEVKCNIICDYCWYVRKYIREVDPNKRVSIPGITNLDTAIDFLDLIYQRIESRTLPIGQEYSDIDPDNYFDVLNWHPYSKISPHHGALDQDWVDYQNTMYDVAKKHGDDGKPVLFSELGWTTLTDVGEEEVRSSQVIGQIARDGIKTIKANLPWVESIYYFRLTNLYRGDSTSAGGTEEFWGLFYHPEDPEHLGAPRESAKAIAKEINGEDYKVEDHITPINELK